VKTAEFKKILKPLIKQTIKEVILEEGILSGIVSEVVRGMGTNLVMETKENSEDKRHKENLEEEKYERQRQERIRRLNESTKMKTNIFEGTREIASSTAPTALSGIAPADDGVDISGILDIANGRWKKLI